MNSRQEGQNPEKTSGDAAHTTNIDQKVERNINHFYNCKFVINSREGSKATLRDACGSQSRSRSKDRKIEDEEAVAKELSGAPLSPKGTDDNRVQKLIEKIGSYASFKLNNQRLPDVPDSEDQVVK